MPRIAYIFSISAAFLLGYLLKEVASTPVGQLPDGGNYRGALVNGRLQGEGEITWLDGSHYQGEFDQGLFHGRGVYNYTDGSRYEGQFEHGKLQGHGTLQYSKNSSYIGQFSDNHRNGHGIFKRGENVYEGEFVNDKFTGQGSHREGGMLRYSGGFRNWEYSGEGQYFDDSGQTWKGTFVKGSLQGKGEYSDTDGNRYVGDFNEWQFQGKGIYYNRDKSRYEGLFSEGRFQGEGIMYLPAPEHGVLSYRGTWRNGTLISAEVPAFVENTPDKLENALYSEKDRLANQLQQITAGMPGVTELFFLGVAGDGTQRVFGREIDFVTRQLQQRYPLEGRAITLINDRFRIGEASMATRTSIEKAVQALASQMNRDEDVLFLYLTSHGSEDHRFMLDQSGVRLPDLDAATLAEILDKSGIRHQILMVSACFSGGFLPAIKGPDRLVITAAAADRTSFGCADHADLTYFGEAFFKEAFPSQPDWVQAFSVAKQWIERREKEEKKTPSQPQIAVGERIHTRLALLQRHAGT